MKSILLALRLLVLSLIGSGCSERLISKFAMSFSIDENSDVVVERLGEGDDCESLSIRYLLGRRCLMFPGKGFDIKSLMSILVGWSSVPPLSLLSARPRGGKGHYASRQPIAFSYHGCLHLGDHGSPGSGLLFLP